jgi:hypothetical protein
MHHELARSSLEGRRTWLVAATVSTHTATQRTWRPCGVAERRVAAPVPQ